MGIFLASSQWLPALLFILIVNVEEFVMLGTPVARRVSRVRPMIDTLEARRLMSMSVTVKAVPISSAAISDDPTLSNYKTLDVQVTVGSGDDWISGELSVNLTSGSFYNNTDGGNTAEKQAFKAEPSLEFDTYVCSPNFGNPTVLGTPTFSSNKVSVQWGDTTNTGAGTFTVARLTVTKSAVGTIAGDVFATSAPTTPIPFASSVASQVGTIQGNVFNDLDGNGVKNSGDPNQSGWRIFIDLDGDKVWDSNEQYVRSDSHGNYKFSNLQNGTYRLCETLVDSTWRHTTPANGVYTVVLTGGGSSTKNWGNTQCIQISGSVFNDANGNKTFDSSELGLVGWRVFYDKNNDGKYETSEVSVLTDSDGNWVINKLKAGTYNIRVVQQTGWKLTTQSTFTVKLSAGQTVGGKNYGEKHT